MKEVQVFKNEQFGEIRIINKEGEPWFVAKDVAERLGYKNTSDAIFAHVDEDDKKKIAFSDYPQFGNKGAVLINESGLYSLILSSKLPNAKKFKKWVTSEVLPQIRQTGGYIPLEEDDSESDIMAKALLIAQKTLDKKDKIINYLKPKAEGFEQFINTENLYKWNVVAKNLGIGRNTMLGILRGQKILMTDVYIDKNGKERRGENHNVPYQPYMKYFDVKFSMVSNRRCATVLVKASGQDYLRKKLIKLGYIHNAA